MPSQLETLSGLERRLTLTISPQDIDTKVQERLRSPRPHHSHAGISTGQGAAENGGKVVRASGPGRDPRRCRRRRIQVGHRRAQAARGRATANRGRRRGRGPDRDRCGHCTGSGRRDRAIRCQRGGGRHRRPGARQCEARHRQPVARPLLVPLPPMPVLQMPVARPRPRPAPASANEIGAATPASATGGPSAGTAATPGAGAIPPGFTATFEVYPEVALKDPAQVKVERFAVDVGDAELERTLEMLRKQRTTYSPIERSAANGDRLTIDFTGRLDGEAFEGGSGNDVSFVLGEGRMLPAFEQALVGAAPNQTPTFPLTFPDDYGNKGVAGKTVSFEVTVKKVEAPEVPELDEEFARTMGVADGDVAKFRADVRANLEREVAQRIRARTKSSAMDAIASLADIEVPKALMAQESEVLAERMKADLKARGVDVAKVPVPAEAFKEPAEKRVRLGLIVGEIVRANQLQAKPDQMRRQIEDLAKTYENPGEVIRWYYSDRERLAEVEAIVVEQNVVDWLLAKADVNERKLTFDELMTDNG